MTGCFDLVRVHDTGAAFSVGASGWQRWFCVGMLMGGPLGNVIDRLLHGHVVGSLQFRSSFSAPLFAGGCFHAFDVAGSAITPDAAALAVNELLRVERSR